MSLDDELEISFEPPRRRASAPPSAQPELPLDLPPPQRRAPWRVRDVCSGFCFLEGEVVMLLGTEAGETPAWLIECTTALGRFINDCPDWFRQQLENHS